jgi:hypothetical protein
MTRIRKKRDDRLAAMTAPSGLVTYERVVAEELRAIRNARLGVTLKSRPRPRDLLLKTPAKSGSPVGRRCRELELASLKALTNQLSMRFC